MQLKAVFDEKGPTLCRSCRSCRMLNRSESYRINKAVESVDFDRSSHFLKFIRSSHELMKSLGATPVAFLPSTTLERDSTYEQQLLKSDVDSVTKKRLSTVIDQVCFNMLQPSTRSTIHYHSEFPQISPKSFTHGIATSISYGNNSQTTSFSNQS